MSKRIVSVYDYVDCSKCPIRKDGCRSACTLKICPKCGGLASKTVARPDKRMLVEEICDCYHIQHRTVSHPVLSKLPPKIVFLDNIIETKFDPGLCIGPKGNCVVFGPKLLLFLAMKTIFAYSQNLRSAPHPMWVDTSAALLQEFIFGNDENKPAGINTASNYCIFALMCNYKEKNSLLPDAVLDMINGRLTFEQPTWLLVPSDNRENPSEFSDSVRSVIKSWKQFDLTTEQDIGDCTIESKASAASFSVGGR